MKVSILIPVYGVEKYIERCARSVFEQTYEDLEIIFVDDCSPDNSIAILKRVMEDYTNRKEQIKIIRHEKNSGLSAARNTAMKASSGEYIYFLDSDDSITKDCIEMLVDAVKNSSWDMVTADYGYSDSNGIPNELKKTPLQDAEIYGSDILKSFSCKWHWNAWNKLLNSNYLKKFDFKFIEGIYFEDVPFTFKIACTANAVKVISNDTYIYTNRSSSISHNTNVPKYIQSYTKVVADMRKVQKQYDVYNYDAEKWIQVFEDKVFSLLGDKRDTTLRTTYRTLRSFDRRTFYEKWLCYNKPIRVLPYNIHWFFPVFIGYYWYRWYGFWRKR